MAFPKKARPVSVFQCPSLHVQSNCVVQSGEKMIQCLGSRLFFFFFLLIIFPECAFGRVKGKAAWQDEVSSKGTCTV